MITFMGKDKVLVTTDTHEDREFHIDPIRTDETVDDFLERIMNTYWYKVNKNRRIHYDEVVDGK